MIPSSADSAYRLADLGMSGEEAAAKAALFEHCTAALQIGGAREVPRLLFVPGRVEFLGKHTDYAGGRSLLCTVPRGLCASVLSAAHPCLDVIDVQANERRQIPLSIDARGDDGHWSTYAAAVARRMALNFPRATKGCRLAFASDLPPAAGLSSSSALVVCFFLALLAENELCRDPDFAQNIASDEDLAGYLGSVENGSAYQGLTGERGVGTFGGSEDHTAILCCQPGALAQYRFLPIQFERRVALPPDYQLLIATSGVRAEKTAAARDVYNRVSLAVRKLLTLWKAQMGKHDVSLATAMASSPDAYGRLTRCIAAARDDEFSSLQLQQRLDQFMTESEQIIPAVADRIAASAIADISALVDQSQAAAEEKLQNQIPETIFLAHSARTLGAVAASAFGAGWGGSVWALAERNTAGSFLERWRDTYLQEFPQHTRGAVFFPADPGPPATWLSAARTSAS